MHSLDSVQVQSDCDPIPNAKIHVTPPPSVTAPSTANLVAWTNIYASFVAVTRRQGYSVSLWNEKKRADYVRGGTAHGNSCRGWRFVTHRGCAERAASSWFAPHAYVEGIRLEWSGICLGLCKIFLAPGLLPNAATPDSVKPTTNGPPQIRQGAERNNEITDNRRT